ncbi:MAG: small ribosomal subunit Rsm22 family protein [Dehalococcoidia bacterium]
MLPGDLNAAIAQMLHGVPAKSLARSAQALSSHYRGEERTGRRAVSSESDVLAYLTYRLPATYAAVTAAFVATAERRPDLQPRNVLDAGAGPGTAMWAATEVWRSVETFMLVENDPRMIAAGKRLAAEASNAAIRGARWLSADLAGEPELPRADVVIAAYSIGELSSGRLPAAVARLWAACADTLVVVEPGTPRGFAAVRTVRDMLRAEGASIVAPCPHQDACPMAGDRWCHFAVRLGRSRLHRAAKGAALAYEDEKYSYVAMSRAPGLPIAARVIGHPRARHGHIDLDLCTPDGLHAETVNRSDRDRYRLAQRTRWGSAID